jgi:hypothetical protein
MEEMQKVSSKELPVLTGKKDSAMVKFVFKNEK